MGQVISAIDKFAELSQTVTNFRNSSFLHDNPELSSLEDGFLEVAKFLLERPAMLVSDSQNLPVLLQFLNKEWYEAEHADLNEDLYHFFAEAGDVMFFAFVSGVLHWDQMDATQKDFVSRALNWCADDSLHQSVDLLEAVKYVATEKDPINYRSVFYQLIEGETVGQVRKRVPVIGKLHRKIREQLNSSEISGAEDVLHALAVQYDEGMRTADIAALQIAALFEFSGLNLEVHAYR